MKVQHLGLIAYEEALSVMEQTLSDRIAGQVPDTLLICEHPSVYTVGRSRGAKQNVLMPGDIPVVETRRGGDVTFHGPGQVVGYPIFALPPHRQDLHGFLRGLEESLIACLAEHGIVGTRDDRNTGVWVGGKKMAAIGIACRRWVTWHGFALNVSVDLEPYRRINPCGMDSDLVTRMHDHLVDPAAASWDGVAADAARCIAAWWSEWCAQPTPLK